MTPSPAVVALYASACLLAVMVDWVIEELHRQ